MSPTAEPPPHRVRPARMGDEAGICTVCRAGFTTSSRGLLSPTAIDRQADLYYTPARVRQEIASGGSTPEWQGYVVAVSEEGTVLGAGGGGVVDRSVGQVLVLYLDPALRGRGIGTALLGALTEQQVSAGATEQWVSVTEGNELGLPFYLARGFVVRDRVPFVIADDGRVEAHSLRMSRPL